MIRLPVAYLGYGRHGTCHGRHVGGGAKTCLAKNKKFYLKFLECLFCAQLSQCTAASTQRPYVIQGVLCQHHHALWQNCCIVTQHGGQSLWKTTTLACRIYKTSSFSHDKKGWVSLSQARNQLGTPGGAKSFLRGAQIFWTMPNTFKRCKTHFSWGGMKIF